MLLNKAWGIARLRLEHKKKGGTLAALLFEYQLTVKSSRLSGGWRRRAQIEPDDPERRNLIARR